MQKPLLPPCCHQMKSCTTTTTTNNVRGVSNCHRIIYYHTQHIFTNPLLYTRIYTTLLGKFKCDQNIQVCAVHHCAAVQAQIGHEENRANIYFLKYKYMYMEGWFGWPNRTDMATFSGRTQKLWKFNITIYSILGQAFQYIPLVIQMYTKVGWVMRGGWSGILLLAKVRHTHTYTKVGMNWKMFS